MHVGCMCAHGMRAVHGTHTQAHSACALRAHAPSGDHTKRAAVANPNPNPNSNPSPNPIPNPDPNPNPNQVITPSVRPWVLLCFPGDRVTLEAAEEP